MRERLLALTGGTIYTEPFSEPIVRGVLLIEGSRISAVGNTGEVNLPDGCTIVDCSSAAVASGFWNCHVHFTERRWSDAAELPASELSDQLLDFTRFGFTSLYDLSSLYQNTQTIRKRIDSGEVDGPRIFSTGEGIVPQGGAPPDIISRMMGWMTVPLHEIAGEREAAAAARQLLESGVDAIKLFASGPSGQMLSEAEMRAVVRGAHDADKAVFVHPNTLDDMRRALAADVDVIAHTLPRTRLEKPDIAKMVDSGMALIPTLALWKQLFRHDRLSVQTAAVESVVEQVVSFRSAGGSILFGTDYGATSANPTDEYELMAEAGMGFADILAALTTQPSQRFAGRTRTGRISPGEEADVVVMNGDSVLSAGVFSDIRLTIRSGRIVYSAPGAHP